MAMSTNMRVMKVTTRFPPSSPEPALKKRRHRRTRRVGHNFLASFSRDSFSRDMSGKAPGLGVMSLNVGDVLVRQHSLDNRYRVRAHNDIRVDQHVVVVEGA